MTRDRVADWAGVIASSPREPFCIHSDDTQPASSCNVCQDGPELAAWKKYWREHPELIPAEFMARYPLPWEH